MLSSEGKEAKIRHAKSFLMIFVGTEPENDRERLRFPRKPIGLTANTRLSPVAVRTITYNK